MLHLALVPRPLVPPDRLLSETLVPLNKLSSPGPKLRDLKLVISAHDWSWLVPSLEASMFPALRRIAITPAQHVDGLNMFDGWEDIELVPVGFYSPPEPRQGLGIEYLSLTGPGQTAVVKLRRCAQMDSGLVRFLAVKRGTPEFVEVRFIGQEEEDAILLGKSMLFS